MIHVSAARALLAGDPELARKDAEDEEALRWPKPVMALPANGRDEEPLDLIETDYSFSIKYDGSTPEGLAARDAWLAEAAAKNDEDSPKTPQLLLPAPDRKITTSAERGRAYRARQKLLQAAA